ncbi:MAG: hypothetical protein ACYS0F_18080, partial [Planctomycetota bacterium]
RSMLNSQTCRPTPTEWARFTELDFVQFDESSIVAPLECAPPDSVALVHTAPDSPGVGFFGHDQRDGLEFARWIRRRCPIAERIGGQRFAHQGFGGEILARRSSQAAAAPLGPWERVR